MRTIKSEVGYEGTEHFVVEVDDQPLVIDFVQQVDDLMVSSPHGDVFISWDNENFSETNCLLLTPKDNLKEINKASVTKFYIMTREKGAKFTVWVTGQRN